MLRRVGKIGRISAVIGAAALVVAVGLAGFLLATKATAEQKRRLARPEAASLTAVVPTATPMENSAFSNVATDATLALARGQVQAPSTSATGSLNAALAPPPTVKAKPVPPKISYIDMYRGLGSWVDIYDDKAWSDPVAAVSDMASRGVRTLYIETSNSRSNSAFKDAGALATFIQAAHARKMKVVAWYLPDLTDVPMDFDRVKAAIEFRTSDGQRFDSFGLDIESTVVASESQRNAALVDFSNRIRGLVGPKYPLGAITPSAVGVARNAGYWPSFPYEYLAKTYDVFVPMAYYTYHGSGGPAALQDALDNIQILRSQPGCANKPIHMIGGISDNSTDSEVRAFAQACVQQKVYGASLYGWVGTSPAMWTEMQAITPRLR